MQRTVARVVAPPRARGARIRYGGHAIIPPAQLRRNPVPRQTNLCSSMSGAAALADDGSGASRLVGPLPEPLDANARADVPQRPPPPLAVAVRAAATWQELTQLYERHAASLDAPHAAAMLTQLPKLAPHEPAGASDAVAAQLLARLAAHDPCELSPRALANVVWALAKLRLWPGAELWARMVAAFMGRLPAAADQVRRAHMGHACAGLRMRRRLPSRRAYRHAATRSTVCAHAVGMRLGWCLHPQPCPWTLSPTAGRLQHAVGRGKAHERVRRHQRQRRARLR